MGVGQPSAGSTLLALWDQTLMPPGHLYSAQTLGPRLLLWAKVEETAPPTLFLWFEEGDLI